MLGFPLLYFKGMRLMMFRLSSFFCRVNGSFGPTEVQRQQKVYESLSGVMPATHIPT